MVFLLGVVDRLQVLVILAVNSVFNCGLLVLDVLHSVSAESVDLIFVALQIGLSQFSGVVCIVA